MNKEYCIYCDNVTGKTGEDSLYFGDDGPLCEDCYDDMKSRFCEKWPTKSKNEHSS